jgi:hypothetical protein
MIDFTRRDSWIGGAAVSPTATLPAVPLMADTVISETPFPPLELWGDGRRIPGLYKPESFERRYFDAQLTDGRTLVPVFYIDQDPGERRFVYRARTDGLQQFFIASEREVLVNVEGSDAARVTAVPASNPDGSRNLLRTQTL